MHTSNSTRLERLESHRAYTETLLQSFYQLKQTTRNHVILVYDLTMGRQALSHTDSYYGIREALRFLGANISTNTDPEDLLIAWVDERNKSAFEFVHEPDRDELKSQAARSFWTFHELKVITAKWMQGKDEDKLVRLGKGAMQTSPRHRVSTPNLPTDVHPIDSARHMAARPPRVPVDRRPHNTLSADSRAHIRQAWEKSIEKSTVRNPSLRLIQSLRLLGITEKRDISKLLNWLRKHERLQCSQMTHYPWELAHLELLAGRCITGSGQSEESVCEPSKLPRRHQTAETKQDGRDDDMVTCAVEELIRDGLLLRDELSSRHGDPITLDLITAVTKAHDAAKEANDNATNAYNDVSRRTAELVTHLVQRPDHTAYPAVMPGRYLEAPQHVEYPWRSGDKRRR